MEFPKVNFKFNKEEDLRNIWETCNNTSSWYDYKKTIHSSFLEICQGKNFEECRDLLEKRRIKMYDSGIIEIFTESIQKAWNIINNEFFARLEKLMKNKIYTKEFTAYITTVLRCPYNLEESWFMVSFFRDISNALKTAGHELMHLQFHNTYWPKIEMKIGEEKTADLKEALTILLNLEFKDLWFVEDQGYEKHTELRNFIKEQWEKEKDFDILMERCVEFLQKNDN
ncbi:MAG: hypothetical protein AABX30_02060 [Nanoarchaeota archaeon]